MSALPRRIAVIHHSSYRALYAQLTEALMARWDAEIWYYCQTEQQVEAIRATPIGGRYRAIKNSGFFLSHGLADVEMTPELTARACACEARLGDTFGKVVMRSRHFGRGYAITGRRHPRTRMSENARWEHVLNHLCEETEFWEAEFDANQFDLVINPGKIAALVCNARNVRRRYFFGSGYKSVHLWTFNEFDETPELADVFPTTVGEKSVPQITISASAQAVSTALRANESLVHALRQCAIRAAQQIYWSLRGYQKSKSYLFWDVVLSPLNVWRDYRQLRCLAVTRLSDLKGRRFVFYPLHEEPETALTSASPEFFFQLEAIAGLARDLPADVLLVVKEHPVAVGRRTAGFYRHLLEFKNLRLMSLEERGAEIAAHADAVATICGTVGLEAAFYGRPVVMFSRHAFYNITPHVRSVRVSEELAPALRWALSDEWCRETAQRDGRRMFEALLKVGVDCAGYSYTKPDYFPSETVPAVVDALERTLAFGVAPSRRAEPAATA